MQRFFYGLGILLLLSSELIAALPIISNQPTNQTIPVGGAINLSVAALNATSYQWRFNGTNLPGATRSFLQIASATQANSGYYVAIVKNQFGSVPSTLVFVSVAYGGVVRFSNVGIPSAIAYDNIYGAIIQTGTAQVVAGPTLDSMQPIPGTVPVSNGYFGQLGQTVTVPSVSAGQTVYYRVDISYEVPGAPQRQQSTVLALRATPDIPGFPPASISALRFPTWPEWPEPNTDQIRATPDSIRIPGESIIISNFCIAYGDFGVPTLQWRKDGVPISAPLTFSGPFDFSYVSGNCLLALTNIQEADAGVYDAIILGNNWLIGPQTRVGVQTINGSGVLTSPRVTAGSFACDLEGIAGRNYSIEASPDLQNWTYVLSVSNATGTATFTQAASQSPQYYRARLLP